MYINIYIYIHISAIICARNAPRFEARVFAHPTFRRTDSLTPLSAELIRSPPFQAS